MNGLKRFRKTNKITQSELGTFLKVGQSYISQIEKGGRSLPLEYISKLSANKQWDTSILAGEASATNDERQKPASRHAIRYRVDVDTTAGGVELFDNSLTSHHITPTLTFPNSGIAPMP